ncbi:non-homologous end joining protein Ku [Cereibacter changlensis]|uniref:non-homologous end joining protein Ku n=1 Tax=Cereibacter changlensis TaxID=402884 RepID=UPI004034925C
MPRAIWKGYLKVGELVCPVALYAAASTAERVSFHTINRKTGHRVHRDFVDSESGKPVAREDQAKGYEVAADEYILLSPEDIAGAIPESDKTLAVRSFIGCAAVDAVYFDKPYYIGPADPEAEESFVLLREGMRAKKVAALAQTVLFRRLRTLLIRPHDDGIVGTTLNFDYEVRSAEEAFAEAPKMKIKGEMLDLAKHIIQTKAGTFDPTGFDDRYDAALAELVQAKLEGRKLTPKPAPKASEPGDLLAALRESAGKKTPARKAAKPKAKPAAAARRKAG